MRKMCALAGKPGQRDRPRCRKLGTQPLLLGYEVLLLLLCQRLDYQLGKNCNYPEPFVVSATKTGLVKKARAAEPGNNWTEKSLFYGAAAFFRVEGYPVPAGFHNSGPYSGARVTRN